MADILDISVFENGKNCISLGKLSPDMIAFLVQKAPHLSGILRACLKNHSSHLYAPLCVIFMPNSGYIARYAPFIWHKSPTNCDAHLTESIFQTRSSPETDILFWKDRIKHAELHKKDFISDNEFYNCLEQIPSIIANPDYLSIHPKDSSISFIKNFSSHIAVAIRISATGTLSFRTIYPIMDAQLTNYIDHNRAWPWNKK